MKDLHLFTDIELVYNMDDEYGERRVKIYEAEDMDGCIFVETTDEKGGRSRISTNLEELKDIVIALENSLNMKRLVKNNELVKENENANQ